MMIRRFDVSAGSRARRMRARWPGEVMLALVLLGPWPGTAALAAGGSRFEVMLEDGRPRHDDRTLSATAGDTVSIRVRSDRAATLHLHGYDRELRVPADGQATLRLDAAIPGRFPIELHGGHGHGPILYLEIQTD